MRLRLTPLALLLLVALPVPLAHAQRGLDEEVKIDQRFDVPPGTRLVTRVEDADVVVERGAPGEARIQVILLADDLADAQAFYERQRFRVERTGDAIEVTTDPVRRTGFSWVSFDNARIVVRATIPPTLDADVRTVDGDVTVEALAGAVRLETTDGDIAADELGGGPVTLRTVDGDVTVRRLVAPEAEVSVQTVDGDVSLEEVEARASTIRTTDGDVAVGSARGRTTLRTADGSIRIGRAAGSTLDAESSDGDVVADRVTADAIRVRTDDGDLVLRAVDGPLDAATAEGDVSVGLLRAAPVTLRSGDGDIVITAPARLGAELILHGDDVRVARGFDFQGRLEEGQARGTLNGGGPTIEARSGDGTVTLRSEG